MTTSSFLRACPLLAALLTLGCSGSDVTGTGPGRGSESGSPSESGSGSKTGSGSGSASGSAAEALFTAEPGASATPDSLLGVWGGQMKELSVTFDTRMKIGSSSVTFATRCVMDDGRESAVVAVTASARVTSDNIAILESKKDEKNTGGVTCRANARPGETKRCAKVDGFQKECFHLDGTALTFYGATPFEKLELTKISD
jgi:hypothetical protein